MLRVICYSPWSVRILHLLHFLIPIILFDMELYKNMCHIFVTFGLRVLRLRVRDARGKGDKTVDIRMLEAVVEPHAHGAKYPASTKPSILLTA